MFTKTLKARIVSTGRWIGAEIVDKNGTPYAVELPEDAVGDVRLGATIEIIINSSTPKRRKRDR